MISGIIVLANAPAIMGLALSACLAEIPRIPYRIAWYLQVGWVGAAVTSAILCVVIATTQAEKYGLTGKRKGLVSCRR